MEEMRLRLAKLQKIRDFYVHIFTEPRLQHKSGVKLLHSVGGTVLCADRVQVGQWEADSVFTSVMLGGQTVKVKEQFSQKSSM